MEITDIKSKLTLSTVLSHYNLKPDKNLRLNCPFHQDKTPSLQVYYKTHTAYCFSSNCKTHGKSIDVIDFVLHKENCNKATAILKAVEILNYYEGKVNHQHNLSRQSGEPIQINEAATLTVSKELFLQNMFTYFKNAVHNSKPAQEYIKQRGLDAVKIEVGYNTAQFHHVGRFVKSVNSDSEAYRKKQSALINNCVAIGLLAPWGVNNRKPEEQAYKAFGKECICFALRNQGSHITGLYFRSTTNNSDQKHFYLKESEGLYPSYPVPQTEKLIIAESIIDAASLLQIEAIAKQYTILAAYGTNRLNDEMQTAIKELQQLKEIIFAFDNDEAGRQAAIKYATQLKEFLPNIFFTKLELPCKDVNETLQAHPAECGKDIFLHLLEQRSNIFFSNEKSIEKENPQATLFIETTPKPIQKSNTSNNSLNTSNPYKLIFTTDTGIYLIKGGIDKVMSKLMVTLEIINEKLTEAINKRRFTKLDLYDSKQIEKTAQEANDYLQLIKGDVEKDLHFLTEALDQYRENELLQTTEEATEPQQYILTTTEKNEALQIAKDKNLIEVIKDKLTHTGIIGEAENKTFLFVVGASHIQENPLNALIQGSSGSGKTNLLKGIFKIMPEENKKIYSRCSEKMLYNVPKYYFKNKLVCFEDVDGLGEEAEYAWRELVSNGQLISGVSYKDEKGNIGIKELIVYGPITSIACTTKGAIYADNMSRLFLIAIDESKEQTQKINEYQAKEAAGQINKSQQQQAIKQLQNFTRLLEPYQVHNPNATKLKLPEGITDERRLYRLYLYFIDMITVLHQYQRKKTGQGKLIATKQDCQIAKDLMFECIMLKMDELDGSLRQFFERLKDYTNKQNNTGYEFTQREIREALQVKKTALSYYINELMSLEYVQQTSSHINKGNRYRVLHFDNYRKMREDVKAYLQKQIDELPNE
ncbi:MAG: toprim domain-containing protein [Ferruginibacter sp.]